MTKKPVNLRKSLENFSIKNLLKFLRKSSTRSMTNFLTYFLNDLVARNRETQNRAFDSMKFKRLQYN